jgi:hypothetical protein
MTGLSVPNLIKLHMPLEDESSIEMAIIFNSNAKYLIDNGSLEDFAEKHSKALSRFRQN